MDRDGESGHRRRPRCGATDGGDGELRPELKELAGVRAGGRRLEKPVAHYSLSWGPDEKPTQAKMVTAARASLRALGLEQHQAVLVAHRDGTTPHVHVVANRVSIEDGRAAPLSQSRLELSRWAEAYERTQGRIRCPRRVEHNRDRRLVGPQYDPYRTASMYGGHTGDAHYRRTQCGRVARVPIADGRSALEMAGVAVRRVDEQRKWQTVRARRDGERGPLDEKQRGEWAALYTSQEDDRDRLDVDCRSLRGRVERWRTNEQPWRDLGGVIRGKADVLDEWRHDLAQHQRQERAALGREHGAQALEVDRRAQRTYEHAMHEPVMMHREDLDAIAQELKHQGLQPGPTPIAPSRASPAVPWRDSWASHRSDHMTENQRAAPTSTSARAASGGRRAKKMGGQKIAAGKKSNRRNRSRSRCSCRSTAGVNTDPSERA